MKKILALAAVLVLTLAAIPGFAQSITGSIEGRVLDEQGGALPGAAVTLTGKTGARTATTGSDGTYRFPALDPGTYLVRAEMSGFSPRSQDAIAVSVGKTYTVDFQLKVGNMTDTVDVVGEAPMVDTTSTQTSNALSQDILYNMPIDRRSFNILNFAPGINNDSAFGGGSGTANALLLDGVDTRDPEAGTAWTFFNYNIIEEVQVQGLGAPAEYGSYTGAIINTVSKSGGNEYQALFDAYYTNDSLAGDNITDEIATANPTLAKPTITTKYVDLTAQLSGPIVRDKLFFFVSAQRFFKQEDPAGPRTIREEISPRINAKLTYVASQSDTLIGNFQMDDYNIKGRPGYPGSFSSSDQQTVLEDAPELVWNVQWRHLFGSKTFLEAKYLGWWGYFDLFPADYSPVHYDGATGAYSGGGGYYYYADRGRHQLNASVSHFAEAFGKHDLKFGVEIERSRVRSRYGYVEGGYYYDYAGPYYAYDYSYDISGRNQRNSAYAQDSWKPTDRLTINGGVRWDQIKGRSPELDETVFETTSVAPRIGFAWDVTGDHNTVVKAHYGQYYEGAFFTFYSQSLPGIEDFVGYDVTGGDRVEASRSPAVLARIDDDIKHPRVDEFTAGIERALGRDLRFSLTGIHRVNKNFISTVYPSARWQPVTLTTSLGTTVPGYRWANRDEAETDFLTTNVHGFQYFDVNGNLIGEANADRKYRGLMAVLSKRFTNRWQAQVSYVLSKTEGTVDPTSAANYGQSRLFQTPSLALVNAYGETSNSRRHEMKAYVTYQIPVIELAVNAYYRMISGQPYTPYQRFTNSQLNFLSSGRDILLEPRGSRKLDTENVLDLRLEKIFKLGGGRDRLSLYADIQNALNKTYVTTIVTRTPSLSIGGFDVPFEGARAVIPARQVTLGARWAF